MGVVVGGVISTKSKLCSIPNGSGLFFCYCIAVCFHSCCVKNCVWFNAKLSLVEDLVVGLLWVVLIDVCSYPTEAAFSTSGPAPLSHDIITIRTGIGVLSQQQCVNSNRNSNCFRN